MEEKGWSAPLIHWLGTQPFVLLFLVVAGGYALGRLKFRGIGLGATASSLLIALALSLYAAFHNVKVAMPDLLSTTFFNLFMFSIGMKVGPQFVTGLKRDAGKLVFFGVAIPVLSIGLLFALRAMMHFKPGLAAGILAGANTATPGLGAAEAAFKSGARLPPGVKPEDAIGSLSTAFALCYCASMALFVLFMRLPDLFGKNTAKAAKELEAAIRAGTSSNPLPGTAEEFLGRPPVATRAFVLDRAVPIIGHPLAELRKAYPYVSIERILRGGRSLEPSDDLILQQNDTLALWGPVERLIRAQQLGREVDVPELRDSNSETADLVITKGPTAGRKLVDLAMDTAHGLYLNAMFRAGLEIPFGPDTVVDKGDVLRVTGPSWRIRRMEKEGARAVRPSPSTDIVTLALGLSLGAAIGAIRIPMGALKISIGSAVGLLLVGIVLSIFRTRQPAFGGPFPEPARQLLEDLGLNVFIAVLGINSGVGVIKALQGGAVMPIVVGCFVVGFVPAIVTWFIGNGPLKMNGAFLLGAVAGGRCNSAGMRAAQEVSGSTIPALSYPVTFALSNIILTIATYVVALLG
jgi:putative transport protein